MAIFDFSSDIIMENERALIRPTDESDYDGLLFYTHEEPELWTYSMENATGTGGLRHSLSKTLEERQLGVQYPFTIIDKLTNSIAGCTRFHTFNFTHYCVSIGYTWLGKKFHRTGLNRHCKWLMFDYAFEHLKMERIQLIADVRNFTSIEAIENLGCTIEGVLRQNLVNAAGERRDSMVLSILRNEWLLGKRDLLLDKIRNYV